LTDTRSPSTPGSTFLIDGNNLGHALGLFDKASGHYDQTSLVALLDGVARYLAAQGQEAEVLLFFDDVSAAERLGAWWVTLVPVEGGDADAAIRAHARAHAGRPQILVTADRDLQGDVSIWGVVSLQPEAFVGRYLTPDCGGSGKANTANLWIGDQLVAGFCHIVP